MTTANYFFFFFLVEDFFEGTFPPARRASDSPMAMACFRLFTFLPDRPLFRVPFLRSCMALLTFCDAFLPYLAISGSSCYIGTHYFVTRLGDKRLLPLVQQVYREWNRRSRSYEKHRPSGRFSLILIQLVRQ